MAYEILARAADVSNQTEMEPDASQRADIFLHLVAETNKALTMRQAWSTVLSIINSLKPSNCPLPWEWMPTLPLYRWAH